MAVVLLLTAPVFARELTLRRSGSELQIIDGGAVVSSMAAATTDHVVIRGTAADDDTLTIDLSQPIALAIGIDYDGGAGGWDTLVLRGGNAREERITQLNPHDGIVDIDGLVIRYTNLEPITDTGAAATLTINGTAGADTVSVTDGPAGTTTVSSPTFESYTFANKTNVTFDGLGGGDTIDFNNPNPATGIFKFLVTNVSTVTQSGEIEYFAFGINATGAVTLNNNLNDIHLVEITTQNGDVTFHNEIDIIVGLVDGSLQGIHAAVTGNVDVQTIFGSITLGDINGTSVVSSGTTSGDVHIFAGGPTSDVVGTNTVHAAESPAGTIFLGAGDDIRLGTTGGTDNDVLAAGQITLQAVNNLTVDGGTNVIADAFGTNSGAGATASVTNGVFMLDNANGGGASFGTGGTGTALVLAHPPASVVLRVVVSSMSGNVTIRSSRVTIDPNGAISAPNGTASFETSGLAPHIDLGSATDVSATSLELSDAEIDRITALVLDVITFTGTITVTQPITVTTVPSLVLETGTLTATGAGSLNAQLLTVNNNAALFRTWTVTPTTITFGGVPVPYSGVTTLTLLSIPSGLFGGGGNEETFNITPSPTTQIVIAANDPPPPASPGDVLDFDLTGVTSPSLSVTLTPSGYQGTLTSSNRQPVTFQQIETIIDAPVNLSITKTDNATTDVAGTSIAYTIVASNPGGYPVAGAQIQDTFTNITNVTWTCTPSAGSSCTGGSGNMNTIATIAAGGSVTYNVTGTISPSATGTLSNTATVTTPAGYVETDNSDNSATDTTALTAEADLQLTKTPSSAPVVPGSDITYTITLRNAGPSDAQNVVLTDVLPANTTFRSIAAPPAYSCMHAAGTVTCSIATLAPSATPDTFTLVVRVDASVAVGTSITNTVTAATTTPDQTANSATSAPVIIAALPDPIPTLSEMMLMVLIAALALASGLRQR